MDAGRYVMSPPERITRLQTAIIRKTLETTGHERLFGLSSPLFTRGVRHLGEDGDGGPTFSPRRPQATRDDCWSVHSTWLMRALLRPSASPGSHNLELPCPSRLGSVSCHSNEGLRGGQSAVGRTMPYGRGSARSWDKGNGCP